jgi:hypothetical protein
MMGRSIYGTGGVIFVTDQELPPGENSSFGSPVEDIPIILIKSEARNKIFSSKEEPVGRYDGTIEKQPIEQLLITHDFAPDLDEDEIIIANPTIVAIKISDGSDVTSSIITDTKIIDPDNSKRIQYGLVGGDDGEDYKVTITVSTDVNVGTVTPGKREVEHFVQVIER